MSIDLRGFSTFFRCVWAAAFGTALGTALAGGASAAEAGDAERGRAAFAQCAACHEVGPEARHKTGPQLSGLFGRSLGGAPDYPYSLPLVAAGLKGMAWDEGLLDAYLRQPESVAPRSDKTVIGLEDQRTRRDIIAYLKSQGRSSTDARKAVRTEIRRPASLRQVVLKR